MNYDIGIVGGGVAGAFAALRLAEFHKRSKAILFELGRPPGKRRRPLEGWLGCFPTGDGKVYPDDIEKVLELADGRRVKAINRWVYRHLNEVNPAKLVRSRKPLVGLQNKIEDAGFDFSIRDYQQWRPDSIHQLSRLIAERIEDAGNISFSFDNEVFNFAKQGGHFILNTESGEFRCKRLVLCAGRSGWRWVNKLYRDLGILVTDDVAKYGIRVEIPAQYLREFNKAHCLLQREGLQVGPFHWGGSIIQEDHADMTIAAFRSNEERWKTDKAFFPIINMQEYENEGCSQTNRLAQLCFLLSGDRVGREKVKSFLRKQDQLSLLPEFSWLPGIIRELSSFIPAIVDRAYYHYPDIITTGISNIRLGSNLESEMRGLYVAGESAGMSGILAAAISGGLAAESSTK